MGTTVADENYTHGDDEEAGFNFHRIVPRREYENRAGGWGELRKVDNFSESPFTLCSFPPFLT